MSAATDTGAGIAAWSNTPGLRADRVRGLANHANAAPNTYWMALYNGGVMKSTDAGGTWAEFDIGFDFGAAAGAPDPALLSAEAIAADPSSTSVVLVGTRGAGLFNLNSGGYGWDQSGVPANVRNTGTDTKPQSLLIPSTNQIYYTLFDGPAGPAAGGLLRSSTGSAGLAQTQYPDTLTACAASAGVATGSANKVVQTSGGRAYLLRWDAPPYRSLDNFTSNAAACPTITNVGFERIAFWDITENPGNAAIMVAATNKGIYRSGDSGVSWSRVTLVGAPAGFSTALSSVAYVGANLYGVSRAGGFYCSTDNGSTWQTASLGGLPPV
jgi:hypothetical protein